MERRRFLAAAVAGAGSLSGCTTSGLGLPSNRRRVSLSNVDDVPDEYELRINIELQHRVVTSGRTARLRMTATDETSRERIVGVGTGDCNPFDRSSGRSKPHGLWLLTPDSANRDSGRKWTTERDGFPAYGCAFSPSIHNRPIVNEYEVWDDGAVDGYMTPDTYRFGTSITIGRSSSDMHTTTGTPQPASLDWGFDLTVENPDS